MCSRRWAEDYLRAVRAEIRRLNGEIEGAITRGAQSAAEIRTGTAERYLQSAAGAAWAELSDRFTDVLSHCRTDALRAMIDGRMYRDGRELSKRIWLATGRLEGQIEEILQQGIAQQQSTWQIARALEAYVNPKEACPIGWRKLYPQTPFEVKVDYNATRLARTAINHVFWQTGILAAQANPFCAAMHWELSNQHYERQVEAWGECACDEYARHDEGLGRGNFKPENLPRPHPNCLCYQYEVLPTPEDAADRFRAWMDGAEDDALEEGFGRWMKEKGTPPAPGANDAVRNTHSPVYYNPNATYSVELPGYSPDVNRGLSKAMKDLALKGTDTGNEHMYLVNLRTGDLDFYETNDNPGFVGFKFRQYLRDHGNEQFAFVHNHNTDGSLSETDLRTLLEYEQLPLMIAVRNDGIIYAAERKGRAIDVGLFDDLYPDDLKVLRDQLKDGIITPAQRTKRREIIIVENLLRDYTKGGRLIEYDTRKE